MKKIVVAIVALLLVVLLPVSAFAAEFTVSDFGDLAAAFTYAGDDVEVIINLEGDIAWRDFLIAVAGKTYILKGTGTNVLYSVGFAGDGTVHIAEIGHIKDSLVIGENVDVTVDADVQGGVAAIGFGVGDPRLTVNGDVTADRDGVTTIGGGTVTVNGDVAADRVGVMIQDGGTVTVNGNVTTGDVGVSVHNGTATVNGNVEASGTGVIASGDANAAVNGEVNAGGFGVMGRENSAIAVEGNITAEQAGVMAVEDSTVTVNGDVTSVNKENTADMKDPEGNDDGHAGVHAVNNANVTVNGNVTGGDSYGTYGFGGTGVVAADTATVTVNGDVAGGALIADPTVQPKEGKEGRGGDGVDMSSGANVTVNGNVVGGTNKSANGGTGGSAVVINIEMDEKGTLKINGTAIGGSNEAPNGIAGVAIELQAYLNLEEVGPVSLGEILKEHIGKYIKEMAGVLGIAKADAAALANAYLTELADYFASIGFDMENGDYDTLAEMQKEAVQAIAQKHIDALWMNQLDLTKLMDIEVYLLKAEGELFGNSPYSLTNVPQDMIDAIMANGVNYMVKLPAVAGGTAVSDKMTAKEGENVTLTLTPEEGKQVAFVRVNGVAVAGSNGVYTFAMPRGGAEITYGFSAITQGGVPKTGDANGMLGLVLLLALCGLATVMGIAYGKKRMSA